MDPLVAQLGRNIEHYRRNAGLSQPALAEQVGTTTKQISRYELGQQELSATKLFRIADALGVSTLELRTREQPGTDFSGRWWFACQVWKDDEERVDLHPTRIVQEGNYLTLEGDRAQGDHAIEEGDYAWTGHLVFDAATGTLIGGYRSNDEGVRTIGYYYFSLHPQGTHAPGHWGGHDYDGIGVRGWAVMARDKDLAEQQLAATIRDANANPAGNLKTWPKTS
jgi:transcriptional regulator with XRE-family HTH domain